MNLDKLRQFHMHGKFINMDYIIMQLNEDDQDEEEEEEEEEEEGEEGGGRRKEAIVFVETKNMRSS